MTDDKPVRKFWYTKKEMAQMTPEERAKNYKKYEPPTEKIQSQLNKISDNQGQILHELSEIRAQLMYQGDLK